MAGHNRWSQIKRKKAAEDAKRSKIFTKLIREILVAVREGGPDPDANPRLRMAIANAKAANMPKDNIERAIKKASQAGAEAYEEVIYEGYGPGGVAIIVECQTDNTNRTTSNLRYIFSKNGGSLATRGAVSHMFNQKGVFIIPIKDNGIDDVEAFALEAMEAGADDIDIDNDFITIYTAREDFGTMQKFLESRSMKVQEAGLQYIPTITTTLPLEEAKKVWNLIQLLEDDDDVKAVYHNLELTEELEKAIS
ncbi:MAG: YebC/PmpR family DNA-binding transcriptional regulator [Chlorobi bacterium]|nr:YebC/PmpR family DNA-binding transcriptional regulator [Chlorobiota bacterium]